MTSYSLNMYLKAYFTPKTPVFEKSKLYVSPLRIINVTPCGYNFIFSFVGGSNWLCFQLHFYLFQSSIGQSLLLLLQSVLLCVLLWLASWLLCLRVPCNIEILASSLYIGLSFSFLCLLLLSCCFIFMINHEFSIRIFRTCGTDGEQYSLPPTTLATLPGLL